VIGFRNLRQSPVVRRADELGASMVEYALMIALIAVVCIGAVQYFGTANGTGINRSSSCIGVAYGGQQLPQECQ
jgi:Flp pilus assembly pilin Flp